MANTEIVPERTISVARLLELGATRLWEFALRRPSLNKGVLAIVVMCFVFWIVVVVLSGPPLLALFRSTKYSITSGQLLSLRIEPLKAARSGGREIVCEYKYSVNGINYNGNVFRYGFAPGRRESEIIRLRFATTGPITVYYDPRLPEKSVLDNAVTDAEKEVALFLAVWLLTLLLVCAIIVWRFVRRRKVSGF